MSHRTCPEKARRARAARCPPRAARALVVVVLLALPSAALARATDCVAREALLERRWDRVEQRLRVNLERPECAPLIREMRYGLAYALMRQTPERPGPACEARALLDGLAAGEDDATLRRALRADADDARAACACRTDISAWLADRPDGVEADLRARLADPACVDRVDALLLELGQVLEHASLTAPHRACEAEEVLRRVAAGGAAGIRASVTGRADRMRLVCAASAVDAAARSEDCARIGDEDGNGVADCADPLCAASTPCALSRSTRREASVGLAIAAGALAIGSGALLWRATAVHARREAAKRDYLDAGLRDDALGISAARIRFDEANAEVAALAISGWSALALGVGLGAASIWAWEDEPELNATSRAHRPPAASRPTNGRSWTRSAVRVAPSAPSP